MLGCQELSLYEQCLDDPSVLETMEVPEETAYIPVVFHSNVPYSAPNFIDPSEGFSTIQALEHIGALNAAFAPLNYQFYLDGFEQINDMPEEVIDPFDVRGLLGDRFVRGAVNVFVTAEIQDGVLGVEYGVITVDSEAGSKVYADQFGNYFGLSRGERTEEVPETIINWSGYFTSEEQQLMLCYAQSELANHVREEPSDYILSTGELLTVGCDENSETTIQEAVIRSPLGATIEICEGTYVENVVIFGGRYIIRGREGEEVVLDGGFQGAIFEIDDGADVDLQNLNFQNGTGFHGGAIGGYFCRLFLNDISFIDNHADGFGGAIHTNRCVVQMRNFSFRNNSSDWGGALYIANTSYIQLRFGEILGNESQQGGAFFFSNLGGDVEGVTIEDNEAQAIGVGDIRSSSLEFNGVTVRNNTTTNTSSGALYTDQSWIAFDQCHLDENTSLVAGTGGSGALIARDSSVTVNGGSVSGNLSNNFAAISLTGETLLVFENVDWNLLGENEPADLAIGDEVYNFTVNDSMSCDAAIQSCVPTN